MDNTFIPRVNLADQIGTTKIDTGGPLPYRLSAIKTPDETTPSFGDMMTSMLNGLNEEATKPDKLVQEAMVNPDIDVHEVMVAINKAELTLQVATQVATKIIQGYEKIISIQV